LKDFLSLYRSEVLGMLLEEFDAEKYERTIREEGREEGREKGREEGREEGEQRVVDLVDKLLEQNRTEDARRIRKDVAYRKRLYQEFDL